MNSIRRAVIASAALAVATGVLPLPAGAADALPGT